MLFIARDKAKAMVQFHIVAGKREICYAGRL